MQRGRKLGDAEFGTHMAPLITAVMNTTGPVFEMGCGDYSTPLLHAICTRQGRHLLSTDTSKSWLSFFKDLESPLHTLQHVAVYSNDWDANPVPTKWDDIGNKSWGVVFVDHRPGERRRDDIRRFAETADIIVVHDTEQPTYGYEPVLASFKYRYDYKRYSTWTTLVSNSIDVASLF